MDKRENMREGLQAMSLVNSKERTRGFGVFLTPDVHQTGGREGSLHFTGQYADIQGRVAKSFRCFGEFRASWEGWSRIADGLGGLSCPNCFHLMRNPVCQALCFPWISSSPDVL